MKAMEGRYASNLLDKHTIVMQQTRTMLVSDYDILDVAGNPIATVATTVAGAEGSFTGPKEFVIVDASGPLCILIDPPDLGADRFEAFHPNGAPLARIIQQLRFFTTAVSIEVAGGSVMEIIGNFLDCTFEIRSGGLPVAHATRDAPQIEDWVLAKDRYLVHLDPNMPPNYRLALVSGLVALNQLREKWSKR